MTAKILIVEDDPDIQKLISLSLTSQDISEVHTADDIDQAQQLIIRHDYEVILLDLNLKNESGYILMRDIDFTYTKVLIVTARDTAQDVYTGFENGAMDFIKKPFDPMELAYRVKSHLKKEATFAAGHLTVNFDTADVFVNEQIVRLTGREYELLSYFIRHANKIVTKDQLYAKVWGYETGVDDNTLMVHIRTLRKKIEDDPTNPEFIQTIRGYGYIFRSDGHE